MDRLRLSRAPPDAARLGLNPRPARLAQCKSPHHIRQIKAIGHESSPEHFVQVRFNYGAR
jgi:hypothetical protein